MSLSKEIIIKLLEKEDIRVGIENFDVIIEEAFESECLKALRKIKVVIENDDLSDFERVEEIARVFEALRIADGGRHGLS